MRSRSKLFYLVGMVLAVIFLTFLGTTRAEASIKNIPEAKTMYTDYTTEINSKIVKVGDYYYSWKDTAKRTEKYGGGTVTHSVRFYRSTTKNGNKNTIFKASKHLVFGSTDGKFLYLGTMDSWSSRTAKIWKVQISSGAKKVISTVTLGKLGSAVPEFFREPNSIGFCKGYGKYAYLYLVNGPGGSEGAYTRIIQIDLTSGKKKTVIGPFYYDHYYSSCRFLSSRYLVIGDGYPDIKFLDCKTGKIGNVPGKIPADVSWRYIDSVYWPWCPPITVDGSEIYYLVSSSNGGFRVARYNMTSGEQKYMTSILPAIGKDADYGMKSARAFKNYVEYISGGQYYREYYATGKKVKISFETRTKGA